ncbi:MAG: SDR family oxidoreductase, partial [Syntrophomonadaceae bacterium]|nr:SDR family oxidoreductase [Syntrophomonadaceae bacterium]
NGGFLPPDRRCKMLRNTHTPLRRIGKPEDIVGPAIFLASGDSDFITGETIVVDGGISIYTNGYGF